MDFVLNEDNEIELENRENMGVCGRECETVRSVCEDVINEDNDPEEIASFLFKNQKDMNEEKLLEFMCTDLCQRDGMRPAVPEKLIKKYGIGEEEWQKMSMEEQQKRVEIFQEIMRQNSARKTEM